MVCPKPGLLFGLLPKPSNYLLTNMATWETLILSASCNHLADTNEGAAGDVIFFTIYITVYIVTFTDIHNCS